MMSVFLVSFVLNSFCPEMESVLKTCDRLEFPAVTRKLSCPTQKCELAAPTEMPSPSNPMFCYIKCTCLNSRSCALKNLSLAQKRIKIIHDWKELEDHQAYLMLREQQDVLERTDGTFCTLIRAPETKPCQASSAQIIQGHREDSNLIYSVSLPVPILHNFR